VGCYWLDNNIVSVIVQTLFADAISFIVWYINLSFGGFVIGNWELNWV